VAVSVYWLTLFLMKQNHETNLKRKKVSGRKCVYWLNAFLIKKQNRETNSICTFIYYDWLRPI